MTRSSIFGSYVRGENQENSDIDILVDLPKGKTLFDLVNLQLQLKKAVGKKVDLGNIQITPSSFKRQNLTQASPHYMKNSQIFLQHISEIF